MFFCRYLYPILGALISFPASLVAQQAVEGYHEFNYGNNKGGEEWVQTIKVSEPKPRQEIKGDVTIRFQAPGMKRARAMCWQQPTEENISPWGHDQLLTPEGVMLDSEGHGSFVFPSDQFPHGPINVRIFAQNDKPNKDIYELQLFNLGGVKWNQGIPKSDPAAAKGLKLIFADDFDESPSISNEVAMLATMPTNLARAISVDGSFLMCLVKANPLARRGHG